MKDEKLISALEEVAAALGVKVSYEKIKKNTGRQPKGGLCYVHGEPRIIVHRQLTAAEKAAVLIEALREFGPERLEAIYIQPEVRQAIEGMSLLRQGDG
ncbi:MAG TPA: hypothetical protein VJM83_01950 [Nitrospirota bacterium]|nr:hypothetical protein [Nitrospirota bacterium]